MDPPAVDTMTHHHQTITSMPVSPDTERHRRMLKYTITMGIRMVCVVLLFFVHGWWLIVVGVGAIALPYFAVVLANVAPNTRLSPVRRPGLVEKARPSSQDPGEDAGGRE